MSDSRKLPLVVAVLFFALCAIATIFIGVYLHIPTASRKYDTERINANASLSVKMSEFINNEKSDALSDLVYIPKVYTIPETDTVAPAPDKAKYGATTDPEVINEVITSADKLLDGQETVWNENIQTLRGEGFQYYCDDTILVITWKEIINDKACSCAEIKIADPSQIRRKITGDTYDSGIRSLCSELSEQANAVIGMNADFYAFRNHGITVYQRSLYRYEYGVIDTCFIDTNGNMIMKKATALKSREDAEQFVKDNDILFSMSFGPILIEDGELNDVGYYPIGETTECYARAAIGMTDNLHYFFMTINTDGIYTTATINTLQDIMAQKGCVDAYTLDGGQTAEIYFNGTVINKGYNSEREVSDILYFATALPSDKGGN